MALLRSLLHALIFYPGSFIVVLIAVLSVPFGSKAVIAGSKRWGRWHRWCAQHILGIRIRFDGMLPEEPWFFVFKHESMFETPETLVLFARPVVVMKQQLVDIPGWGWVARSFGVIPVDREAGATAMRRMIAAARDAKAAGRPVVLFPEGTRVAHGQAPPLQAGFAGLYKVLGLPVIPVALDSGKLWPRNSFIKHAGIVTLKVGEPIPPGLSREEVESRVHAAINALNVLPSPAPKAQ